ncbi:hypothetical protein HY68_35910 [Streptomyces sp. AcH 505]|nr:hypothetical protein HY68_35910 [Streptomyces sp. AcH 505]
MVLVKVMGRVGLVEGAVSEHGEGDGGSSSGEGRWLVARPGIPSSCSLAGAGQVVSGLMRSFRVRVTRVA